MRGFFSFLNTSLSFLCVSYILLKTSFVKSCKSFYDYYDYEDYGDYSETDEDAESVYINSDEDWGHFV